jgi:hypothetical protein
LPEIKAFYGQLESYETAERPANFFIDIKKRINKASIDCKIVKKD